MSHEFYLARKEMRTFYSAYAKIAAFEMSFLPMNNVLEYVSALKDARPVYHTDQENLMRAENKLLSGKSTLIEMSNALETVANIEFGRLFCRDEAINQEIRTLMKEHRYKDLPANTS